MRVLPIDRVLVGTSVGVTLAVLCLFAASPARADTVVLAQTTMISGTESTVDSFTVPSDGTLTMQLSNIPWPEALSSLNFLLSTSSQALSSLSVPQGSTSDSVQVGPGTYFAHLTGTAGGSLDLGLYSISIDFQPAGVVPLPTSGGLLLIGLLAVLALAWPLERGNPDEGSTPDEPGLTGMGVSGTAHAVQHPATLATS